MAGGGNYSSYRELCCWSHRVPETHLAVFSLPEVRWQLTKPKEVPLNMKETPTAPLFPERQKGGHCEPQARVGESAPWITRPALGLLQQPKAYTSCPQL